MAGGALVAAGAAFLAVGTAQAKVGGGGSLGSRGSKTFTAPPSTNTAPKTAQPVQRSTTTAGATQAAGSQAKGGFLSRFGGFGGLLAGGLIGAALASMLGLGGGLAAMLGFILQAALIGGLIYLAVMFFRRRGAPSSGPAVASATPNVTARNTLADQPYQGAPGGGFGSGGTTPLNLGEGDFNAFEKLLAEIQTAYGREDEAALRAITTPEMMGFLGEDVAKNVTNGVRNELSDVKLLQGDLSEAWTEGDSDYASLAMRYSIVDVMVDRTSGKVVSGNKSKPDEVTEVWTFVRPRRASVNAWKLSAIQQS